MRNEHTPLTDFEVKNAIKPSNINTPFCWVITSDPQYPRIPGDTEDTSLSESLIRAQYAAVNKYRDGKQGQRSVPVIINGDLTEYYHGYQREKMESLMGILGDGIYYGLGNHDYENNVRPNPGDTSGPGCYNNSCVQNAMRDMVKHFKAIEPDEKDYFFKQYADSPTADAYGSYAYSKTLGGFLFIQLQNHPGYSITVKAIETRLTTYYHISKSLDWLEHQLINARNQNKPVIINVHRPPTNGYEQGDTERFKRLVNNYGVKAIFCGHTHSAKKEANFGNVPVFNSGAGFMQTFLTAEHNTRHACGYVYRATKNVLEPTPLGAFKISDPITAIGVKTTYSLSAEAITFIFHQTPTHQLAWDRVVVKLGSEPKTVYFPKSQNPTDSVQVTFYGLTPNTTYQYEVTAHTDKETHAPTSKNSIKTRDIFMTPVDFCTEPYPDWERNGFIARWKKPANDNWQDSPMFELGVFGEDNRLIKSIATVADYHAPIPVSLYNTYRLTKYYIGVRAFHRSLPVDKSDPMKYLLALLPAMRCS